MDEFTRERYLEKPLPSHPDAERVIIGGILIDNDLLLQCIEAKLIADDFYSPLHRRIFKAMLNLFDRSERIDPILIGAELKKENQLESIGGVATITNFTFGLPHFSDLLDYIRLVKESAKIRDLIKKCNAITSMALSESYETSEVLEFAEQEIFALQEYDQNSSFTKFYDGAVKSLKKVQEFAKKGQSNNALLGLSTGFKELNQMTSGMQEADLIIIAARPSMGKTSMALSLVVNAVKDDKKAVAAVFSLEMSKEQLFNRLLTMEGKVDAHRFRTGYLIQDEWARLGSALNDNADAGIFVDDTPGISVMEMRAKCRRLYAEQKKLDLIVVDYLQLMTSSRRSESRQQEVSQISRDLKALAKEMKCPVIALSQLSRACEARNPPKPIMSDLRESGQIEADADVVAFIYREEYYKPAEENAGIAELLIRKNRNGPTGVVKLAFLKEFTKFENYYGDM